MMPSRMNELKEKSAQEKRRFQYIAEKNVKIRITINAGENNVGKVFTRVSLSRSNSANK